MTEPVTPMPPEHAPEDPVRRFFRSGFTAGDIAEPMISFDAEHPVDEILTRMENLRIRIAGVRRDGLVRGYLRAGATTGGRCLDAMEAFEPGQVVGDGTPLDRVVLVLDRFDGLFVTSFGMPSGIVTRTDLEKPPARMWLFGLLTVVEQAVEAELRQRYPGTAWTALVSEGRLDRARRLQSERRRRGERVDLLSCLQFGDKGYALFKDAEARERFGFGTRVEARNTMKDLEKLRNALAHSQPIVPGYWALVVQLSGALDTVLDLYETIHGRRDER